MCKLQEVSHRNFSQMTEQQTKHIQFCDSNMDENQDMTNVSEPSADTEKDINVTNANMDHSNKLECNGKNATEIEAKGVNVHSNFKENCSLCRIIEINGEIIDVNVINLNDCNNDHTLQLSSWFYLQDV